MDKGSNLGTDQRVAGLDASRLSMWTVVGAVAASVMTAGILGSVSGILQIPQMVGDVAALRTSREDTAKLIAVLQTGLKTQELITDNLQRQLNQENLRADQMTTRLEAREAELRAMDILQSRSVAEIDTRLTRGLSEIEGRSKDRHTEAMGAISAVQTAVLALNDRQKATGDALNALRANVYELAMRSGRQGSLQTPADPEWLDKMPSQKSPSSQHDKFVIPWKHTPMLALPCQEQDIGLSFIPGR